MTTLKDTNGYIAKSVILAKIETPHFLGAVETQKENLIIRASGDEFIIFRQDKQDNVLSETILTASQANNLALWILAQ